MGTNESSRPMFFHDLLGVFDKFPRPDDASDGELTRTCLDDRQEAKERFGALAAMFRRHGLSDVTVGLAIYLAKTDFVLLANVVTGVAEGLRINIPWKVAPELTASFLRLVRKQNSPRLLPVSLVIHYHLDGPDILDVVDTWVDKLAGHDDSSIDYVIGMLRMTARRLADGSLRSAPRLLVLRSSKSLEKTDDSHVDS